MAEINSTNFISQEFTYSYLPVITISILGAISNTLLLIAFIKDPLKCFRNSGTYLLMSLSVSDCLTCSFAAFHYTKKRSEIGRDLVFHMLNWWFGTTSIVSMASISIDRLIMVCYPIKYRVLIKGKVMAIWIAAIWVGSGIRPVLTLYYKTKDLGGYFSGMVLIILSAILYACTYNKLKQQSRNIALQNPSKNRAHKKRLLKEKQFFNTIVMIVTIAVICIIPSTMFFIIVEYVNWKMDTIAFNILEKIFSSTFYTNNAVNPLIYVLRMPNYRKTFYFLYWRSGR